MNVFATLKNEYDGVENKKRSGIKKCRYEKLSRPVATINETTLELKP